MWRSIVLVFKISFTYISFSIGNVLIRFWPGIPRPVVELRQGTVRGITSVLPDGAKYHYFKGIPYAKPPVGKLRFQPPVPLERFSRPIINCSYERSDLIQPDVVINRIVYGIEDDLYLNVFTPGLPNESETKYPVMVFIHGGGFRYGSPSTFLHDPKYLVQQKVVVVSISYRLGPLGFLSLPSAGISGNMGLKDQRLALQWVQNNIAKFNGDTDNVTLFGQSAGSWCAYLHYLTPASRKYFHRAICISGDSCSEAAFQVDPEGKARKLAQLLGCRGNTDQEVLGLKRPNPKYERAWTQQRLAFEVSIRFNMGKRLALQWVQNNIGQFNGDANNVTLFGQSAGSWSAYLHYLTPESRKYFHRVICMSGDFCSEALFQVDPERKARKLAKLLGCQGNTDREVLETLMKASAKSLVRLQSHVQSPQEDGDPLRVFLFKPVIEHESVEDSFITQMPEQILKSYDTLQMPIMTGNTSGEGLLALVLNRNNLADYNKHVDWLVPRFMGSPPNMDRKAVGEQIRRFFVGEDHKIGRDTANETGDLMTDSTFLGSSNLGAEWIAKYQPNVTHYKYLFTFEGRINFFKPLLNMSQVHGAQHGDDIFYLFGPKFVPNLSSDSVEYKVRDIYVTLMTNFAKYNNPTPDGNTLGFKWKPVTPVPRDSESFDFDCLEVNFPPQMVRNPYRERNEFWRNLMKNHTELL